MITRPPGPRASPTVTPPPAITARPLGQHNPAARGAAQRWCWPMAARLRQQASSRNAIENRHFSASSPGAACRRLWVPELGRFVTLKLTTRDLRTIDKIGLVEYAKRYGAKVA